MQKPVMSDSIPDDLQVVQFPDMEITLYISRAEVFAHEHIRKVD